MDHRHQGPGRRRADVRSVQQQLHHRSRLISPDDFDISIAADIERDLITAAVDYGNRQVAEIVEGEEGLVVTFFPGPGNEWPTVPFEPLMEALRAAAGRLTSGY